MCFSRSDLDLSESERAATDETLEMLDLTERDADRDAADTERRPLRRFNARRQLANDIRHFFTSRPRTGTESPYM